MDEAKRNLHLGGKKPGFYSQWALCTVELFLDQRADNAVKFPEGVTLRDFPAGRLEATLLLEDVLTAGVFLCMTEPPQAIIQRPIARPRAD